MLVLPNQPEFTLQIFILMQGRRALCVITVEWLTSYDGRGSSSIAESVAIVTSVTFMLITAVYSHDSTQRFCRSLNRLGL
jgi:hypothetical protein